MNKQATFTIYTTIDELGGRAISNGWEHGRIVAGEWKVSKFSTKETALKALRGKQFQGRGAYATDGEVILHAAV